MNFLRDLIYQISFITSRTKLIIKEYKFDSSHKYVWGMKKKNIHSIFNQNNSRLIYLEDGLVHSFGYKKEKIPLSVSFDNDGIYYSFKSNSRLFSLIEQDLSKNNLIRSRNIIKLWKDYSISKYNFPYFIEPPKFKYILLIDQTYGDLSVSYGSANKNSFLEMFKFACENWPDHKIVIKVHPDVINSNKVGYLDKDFYTNKNVIVISQLGQINKLIENSLAVCVVTSQVGFEALIYNKEVHVFGRPFYSGLGLTIDHNLPKDDKNNKKISLENLVFKFLTKYQICLDPRTKKRCEVEDIMQYIYFRRKVYQFFPNNLYGIGFSPWKKRQINRFISNAINERIESLKKFKTYSKNILIWGKSIKSDKYRNKANEFISVEDGFIRSVGLGADLYSPLSLLFDKKGIHYDASSVSDIEELLQNRVVNKNELKRSSDLINLIIKSNITKYNLKFNSGLKLPRNSVNKYKIAVLGQVETDNSILFGVPNDTIQKTNFSLIEQVRKDYPNSYIIYKPHPDIESGLRYSSNELSIRGISDFIAHKTSLEDILKNVDRVVVFTSLGGFEALIRGKPVTTYGLPFYAGWGLTDDKLLNHKWAKRRRRILSLEEIVFISLIEYPIYNSLKFNTLTEIENIIEELKIYNNKKNIWQIIFRNWGSLKDFLATINKND